MKLLYPTIAFTALAGGLVFSASCGGGGASFVIPSCALDFIVPNYALVVDPSTSTLNKLRWWRGFPVRVWFDAGVIYDPGGANIFSTDIFTIGIDRWPTVTSNGVRYTVVSNEADAHIKIRTQIVASQPSTLAETVATVDQGTGEVVAAEITIYVWNGMTIEQFRDGLKATSSHEMGHALFIRGHSATNTDLMYWSNSSSLDKAISTPDTNTIQTAYCGNFQDRSRAPAGPGRPAQLVQERTVCVRASEPEGASDSLVVRSPSR